MAIPILILLAALASSQDFDHEWSSLDAGLSRGEIGRKAANFGDMFLTHSIDRVVPGGIAPQFQSLRPRLAKYHPAAARTKVRYGPYRMPSSEEATFSESGESGMLSKLASLQKPCSGECSILAAQSDLEYANGTQATNKDGAWLHHQTIYVQGAGRRDLVCPASLNSLLGERFYSSGNERTVVAYGDVLMKGNDKVKSAFHLKRTDRFWSQFALRNMENHEQHVYLTVEYEWFVPSAEDKKEWKSAKALWLSISGCQTTYSTPPQGQARFTIPSTTWSSPFSGNLLDAGE
jgi:hypothetical protein